MNQAELGFVRNHAVMRVYIKNGKVNLLTGRINMEFDKEKYKKISDSKEVEALSKLTYDELVKQYGELKAQIIMEFSSELEKKRDIDFNDIDSLKKELIKDFQDSGWRCYKS